MKVGCAYRKEKDKLGLMRLWEFEYSYHCVGFGRMSYMDDFIHRLNMIPPQADQLLRQIRAIDREVEQLRLDLDPRRQAFLANLHRWTDKRATKIKAEA
jgi:hypothetical protein